MSYFAIDFDGTCVEHKYPHNGDDLPNAVNVLKRLVAKKHKLIINTMRDKAQLTSAQDWYEKHEIKLFGVNRNPTQVWTKSPKVYAHHYIDDAAIGCPLINHIIIQKVVLIESREEYEITDDDKVYVIDPQFFSSKRNELASGYLIRNDKCENVWFKSNEGKIPVDSRDFVDWFKIESNLKAQSLI